MTITTVAAGDPITAAKMNTKLEAPILTGEISDGAITTPKIADDAITLAKLQNGTQGDILYFGAGGEPARLPAGSAGQYLKSQGAGANPVWSYPPTGTWSVVYETTTTTDAQVLDITGLNINTDKYYILFGNVKNNSTNNYTARLFVEGDYTATNYYTHRTMIMATTWEYGVYNTAEIFDNLAGQSATFICEIYRDSDGYFKTYTRIPTWRGSGIKNGMYLISKTAAVSNITQLRIDCIYAGGLGAGSYILLCKPRG